MTSRTVISIVDCNAYYCSAEALFRPWLRDKAVVVASSNDGCCVARNPAAKKLGIKMGTPVFEIMHLVKSGQLHLFSSNYALYQALSDRVMAIIAELSPVASCYSIDESFCLLTGVPDPHAWGVATKAEIYRRTGIPVSIGISHSKTLAKLANWAAKRWQAKTGGVVDLRDEEKLRKLLQYAPVEEVWGVGSKISRRLIEDHGIKTAWQLAQACPKHIRRHFNVNVERTVRELNGIAALDFHEDAGAKQMIACTRSFGRKLHTLAELEAMIATFVTNVAEKLRRQDSLVVCFQVYLRTSWFLPADERYGRSITVALPHPTSDTRVITREAQAALASIYRDGYPYAKAGIVLTNLIDSTGHTGDLFTPGDSGASKDVMRTMDLINRKMGKNSVRLARVNVESGWGMRREFLSPNYMTDWSQLLKVKC